MNALERTILMVLIIGGGVKYSSGVTTDVAITSLTFASNAVFPKANAAITVKADVAFTLVIWNKGTTTAESIAAITPAATNDENFHVKFQQSNVDFASGGGSYNNNPLTLTPKDTPTDIVLDSPNEVYNGLLFTKSLTIMGRIRFGLDMNKCNDIHYLCANVEMKDVKSPTSVPYVDSDLKNNWRCSYIQTAIVCDPDLELKSFAKYPNGGEPGPMIGTTGMSNQPLTLVLSNLGDATKNHNDIRATSATGSINYAFTGYYAKSGTTATPAAGIAGYTFTIKLSATDLGSGIDAAKSKTFTGSIDYPPLSKTDCQSPLFACIYVEPDNRANGGTFVDHVKTNNYKCYAIIVTCRPDPKPENLVLQSPAAIVADKLIAITFSVDVKNVAATGAKNDIPAVASPLTHFKVILRFSDVDLSTSLLDTLGIGDITTTLPNTADNQVILVAGGAGATAKTLGTTGKHGTATVMISESKCDQVKYFCALLYAAANARYIDLSTETSTDIKANTTCIAVTTVMKQCHPDVDVTALTFASDAILPMLPTKADVEFSVTFKNIRTKDIAKITTAEENFHIKFQESNADLRILPLTPTPNYNPLGTPTYEPSTDVTIFNTADVKNALLGQSKQSLTLKGKVKFGLSATKCENVYYLCINVSPKGTATSPYVDVNTRNNWMCTDVYSQITCAPDLAVNSFTKFPSLGDPWPMIGTKGMALQPLTLELENKATASAKTVNDVKKASGSDVNFAITGYYATANGNPNAATSKTGYSFVIVLSPSELKKELKAGAKEILKGTITYPPLSLTDCLALTTPHACIYVSPNNIANGGTYIEPTAKWGNNHKCELITLTCRPNPLPEKLTFFTGITSAAPLVADVTTPITFSIDVKNSATGTNNGVPGPLVGSKTHFKVELQFSDVDLSLTSASSVTSGRIGTTIPVISENQKAIAPAGSITLGSATGRAKATVTLTEAQCPDVKFLCAILLSSSDARYIDASFEASASDPRPNITCTSLITPNLMKTCHPDVEVMSFNEPNNVVMLMNVQATLTFEVTVKNNDANTDIEKEVGAGKENFHLKFVLSDVDVRNTGTASNTLGIAAFENADVTVSPSTDVQAGLIAGKTKLLKGAVKVKIPNDATKCSGIRYLCVNSMPKSNEYPEDKTRLLNNWKCKDVTKQVSCGIDVEAVSFTTLPTASSPLVGPLGRKGVAFVLQIRNRAKNGPGFDIPAVSSPNKNFALTSFYSTTDIPTATRLGAKANTLTISDSELRIGLPGVNGAGATTPISGSIDYADITATDCPNAKFVCVNIVADRTASYTEAAATLTGVGTNTICHSLAGVRSCAPDPQPNSLVLSTNLEVGKTTTASFTMKIKNVKTTTAPEDVIYLAVSPNFNYKVELKLSDVDMNAAGTTDSLGLPLIPTTLPDTDRRKALGLTTAAEISVSGTAMIPLTSSACEAVRWLCAFLWPGLVAGYLDSSSVAAPKDLKPNTTCVDILNKKGCTPDISILTWSITPPTTPNPLRYIQDVWQDVAFTLDIKNIATGANSGIPLSTTWNYAVDIKFTDKDLALYTATVTNTKAFVYKISTANKGNLKAALPVGSTLSLGGTVRVSLEKAKCNDLKYICAVIEHNALLYGDKDTTNNHKCIDISVVKVCSPDVSISSFAGKPTTAVQYIMDSVASAFKFDIAWQNVAPAHSGNDILPPPTKPAGSNNFQLKMTFSDVDIGSGKTDTLAVGKLSHKLQFPESVAAQTQTITKTGQTYNPTASPADDLIIPQAKCSKVNFLCVYISEGDNAQYIDVDNANNVKCISLITGNTKKNCRPVFENLPNTAAVNENEAVGVSVFTVKGSQGDAGIPSALQYSITTFTAEFQIDSSTGEIKTKQSFNYETKAQYLIQVKVTDGTTGDPLYTATSTLTINIKDVNDKPVFDAKYPFTINPAIPENKAVVVHTMTYTDQDLPKQTMSWSIDVKPSVLPGAPFAINPTGTAGIISITNPGLNFEATAPPTYTLTVHMTDNGVPPKTATPAIVIVPCSDVPELPTIQNLPKTISLYETENNNYDTHIFTVLAADPDTGTTLKYYINPLPFDGKFKQDPMDGSKIQYVKSPNFDHETTSEYKITVIVSDGKTAPVTSILTVKILNNTFGDNPVFTNAHWPAAVTADEDQTLESTLLQVSASDPDNRPLVFSHLVNPLTGQAKFGVDSSGRFYSVHNPDFDYEVVNLYKVIIKVCASANCTTKHITVNIIDKNDAPVCSPSSLHVTTPERGTYNPGKLFTATDQDGGTLTYAKITKNLVFQSRFTIDNTGLIKGTGINYEAQNSPILGMFSVTDAGGLTCNFALTVHVTDTNEKPSFTKSAYNATVTEGSPQGTSLSVVTAKDPDIGENGILKFYVDPLDANKAYSYFQMIKMTATTAHLSVQSPIDSETLIGNTVTFNIYAEDKGKLRDNATVTVTVTNINDNRPTFLKAFYNFEIMYNDAVGKVVGSVSCTDKDVLYNTVSYQWIQNLQKDNFALGSSTGEIASAVTPLDPDREYVLIAHCQDNDPVKIETSLTQAIRVDTYIGSKVLTNWTTTQTPAYYKIKANLDSFLTSASSLCTPCVAKLHSIVDSKSGAILILYFLEDSSTDNIDNIGKEKLFLTASHIVKAYTKDNLKEPASPVTANVKFATHKVTSITRYADEPVEPTNWMLDTVGGNIVLGLIMSLALILVTTASVCIARRFGKSAMAMNQQLDDPRAPYKQKLGRVQPQDGLSPQPREASILSVSHVKVAEDVPFRTLPSNRQNTVHPSPDKGRYDSPSPELYTAPNEPVYQQKLPISPPADFFNEVNRRFLIRPGKFKTAL